MIGNEFIHPVVAERLLQLRCVGWCDLLVLQPLRLKIMWAEACVCEA